MNNALVVEMNKSKPGKPEMDGSKGSKQDLGLAHVHLSSNKIKHCLNRSPESTQNTHIHLHLIPFLEVTTAKQTKYIIQVYQKKYIIQMLPALTLRHPTI